MAIWLALLLLGHIARSRCKLGEVDSGTAVAGGTALVGDGTERRPSWRGQEVVERRNTLSTFARTRARRIQGELARKHESLSALTQRIL